jgi:Arc/MetJ family transcription regulator
MPHVPSAGQEFKSGMRPGCIPAGFLIDFPDKSIILCQASMRITVEIDASELKRIQKITGLKKKSPAVSKALADYLYGHEKHRYLEQVLGGQTDYALTNNELESRDLYETR